MKIGILTHELGTNYGGMLQNYALQKVLIRLGHDPETLDYYTSTPLKIKTFSFGKRLMKKLIGKDVKLRGWMNKSESEYITRNTRRFIDKHIKTSAKFPLSRMSKIPFDYEALIVGSDQVWRGNGRPIEKFFLSDFKDKKIFRIAYAASFGVDWWTLSDKQTEKCRCLLKLFNGISVREEAAVNMCKSHLDIKPELVLDPTLLLDKSEYEKMISDEYSNLDQGSYVMIYVLDKTKNKLEITSFVSDTLVMPLLEVNAKCQFKNNKCGNLDDCVLPSVEYWLAGFKDASFVVTDSFHGTAFSIIFNKPFVVIKNNRRGNSRIESILNTLGLNERLVDSISETENILNTPIDWDTVNQKLGILRTKSKYFIINSLQSQQ